MYNSNIIRTISKSSKIFLQALETQFGNNFLYNFNSFRHSTDWAKHGYERSIKEKKDIMCIETPIIGRKLFNENSAETFFRIGINNVSSYFEQNFFIPKKINFQRIEKILEATDTQILPWRKTGDYILYAMQVPGDSSLLGLDIFSAAQYDLMFLRKISNRPIVISMHPDIKKGWGKKELKRHNHFYNGFLDTIEITNSTISSLDTHTLLDDAWCTVCHTSGVSFDSIAKGVPVIALHERSFMRPLSSTSYYDVENLVMPERMQWLAKVAYTQWNLSEITDGTFKEHVSSFYNNFT